MSVPKPPPALPVSFALQQLQLSDAVASKQGPGPAQPASSMTATAAEADMLQPVLGPPDKAEGQPPSALRVHTPPEPPGGPQASQSVLAASSGPTLKMLKGI